MRFDDLPRGQYPALLNPRGERLYSGSQWEI